MTQMNKNWWLFSLLLVPLLAAQMMHSISLLSVLTHVLISASLVLLSALTLKSPMARFLSGLDNYLWQESVELDQDLINQYVDLAAFRKLNTL